MKINKKDSKSEPKRGGIAVVGDLFAQYQLEDKGGYITQEFQDFGYRLAAELNDMAHKSLYIKMAKNENRLILERALSYVSDSQARSKARLFMWKVKELKKEQQIKKSAKTPTPKMS